MSKRQTLSLKGRTKSTPKTELINPMKSQRAYIDPRDYLDNTKKTKLREMGPARDSFWETESSLDDVGGRNYLEQMLHPERSIVSDEVIGEQFVPEAIVAHRISEVGEHVAAEFLQHVDKATALSKKTDASAFAMSDDPAEKLAYMAQVGNIDLVKVKQAIRYKRHQVEGYVSTSNNDDDDDREEVDFSVAEREAALENPGVTKKTPKELMLSVVGAMTVSKQSYKKDILSPDVITPQNLPKHRDAPKAPTKLFNNAELNARLESLLGERKQPQHILSDNTPGVGRTFLEDVPKHGNGEETWLKKLDLITEHSRTIAKAYIDPSKIEGGEQGAAYQRLLGKLTNLMPKLLQQKIPETGFRMAARRPGDPLVGWTSGLPRPEEVKALLPKSDRLFITDRIDKEWEQDENGEWKSKYSEVLSELRPVLAGWDEGALAKPKNFEYRERQYLLDELAAEGNADPTQTVVSQEASRDVNYEFRVTNDASELRNAAMLELGVTEEDLVGDAELQLKVKQAAIEIAETGDAENTRVVAETKASAGQTPRKAYAYKAFAPLPPGRSGHVGTTLRAEPAPKVAPKPGEVINVKPPSQLDPHSFEALVGAKAEAAANSSGRGRIGAKYDFFKSRLNDIGFIAGDHDKQSPNSLWQRARRSRVTSSGALRLLDPQTRKNALRDLVTGALTPEDKPATISPGSLMTKSGDALEPIALDWYRKNIDSETFEPGMIYNKKIPGQATTPDAITDGGRKLVEVKSRWDRIDPLSKDLTPDQRQTLMKNYAQMQHQMYITGANSTDLVEIIRDPQNPNAPLGGRLKEGVNIFRRTVDRDEDFIRQNRGTWDKAGRQAAALANLSTRDQKALAKAVEDGNLQAFEKLAKKRGIEDAHQLAQDMGFGTGGEGDGGDGRGGRGGGGRGGSGGGGGGHWSNLGGFGGRDAPATFYGATRAGMAMLGPPGRIVNAAMSLAQSAWSGVEYSNEQSLKLSMQARKLGMFESAFQDSRNALASRYTLGLEDATQDLTRLTLAKGGLEVGHPDAAVAMVENSRGMITIGDLRQLDPDNKESLLQFVDTVKKRMDDAGISKYGQAALMDKTGLTAMLEAHGMTEGRAQLNTTVTEVKTSLEKINTGIAEVLGTAIDKSNISLEDISENVTRLVDYFVKDTPGGESPISPAWQEQAKGSFLGRLFGTPEEEVKGSFLERLFGTSEENEAAKEKAAKEKAATPDWEAIKEKSRQDVSNAAFLPLQLAEMQRSENPAAAAVQDAQVAADKMPVETAEILEALEAQYDLSSGMMSDSAKQHLSEQLQSMPEIRRAQVLDTLIANSVEDDEVRAVLHGNEGARFDVNLTTQGIELVVRDGDGSNITKVLKPYDQGIKD